MVGLVVVLCNEPTSQRPSHWMRHGLSMSPWLASLPMIGRGKNQEMVRTWSRVACSITFAGKSELGEATGSGFGVDDSVRRRGASSS